jgi:hypothetical protein
MTYKSEKLQSTARTVFLGRALKANAAPQQLRRQVGLHPPRKRTGGPIDTRRFEATYAALEFVSIGKPSPSLKTLTTGAETHAPPRATAGPASLCSSNPFALTGSPSWAEAKLFSLLRTSIPTTLLAHRWALVFRIDWPASTRSPADVRAPTAIS